MRGKSKIPLFARLNPNVSQEGAIGNGPAVGIAHINDTAAVNKYLAMRQVRELLPANIVFKWTVKPIDEKEQYFQLVALKATNGGRPPLEGDVITDAREDFDRMTNSAVVSMSMNAEGSKIWEQLTRENIGRCVAIVLDDQVYSFPVVNTEISGGNSQISGELYSGRGKRPCECVEIWKNGGECKDRARRHYRSVIGSRGNSERYYIVHFRLGSLMVYMTACMV